MTRPEGLERDASHEQDDDGADEQLHPGPRRARAKLREEGVDAQQREDRDDDEAERGADVLDDRAGLAEQPGQRDEANGGDDGDDDHHDDPPPGREVVPQRHHAGRSKNEDHRVEGERPPLHATTLPGPPYAASGFGSRSPSMIVPACFRRRTATTISDSRIASMEPRLRVR